MSCAVAIFVKTPGHSPVKSRLWPDLGRESAEHLYLASAAAVHSVVVRASSQCDLDGYWATAESVAVVAAEWPGLEHLGQGNGCLGLRMATVYRELCNRHGAAILIGADAPQLESGQLLRAVAWLQSGQARLAMGRADDGGFWLFGGNRALPETAWTGVAYSTADTASDFFSAMNGKGEWLELDVLRDVDTVADIEPVLEQLHGLTDPTPEQESLSLLLGRIGKAAETCA